jgi:hypothetical protein
MLDDVTVELVRYTKWPPYSTSKSVVVSKGKKKGKDIPVTGHEGP